MRFLESYNIIHKPINDKKKKEKITICIKIEYNKFSMPALKFLQKLVDVYRTMTVETKSV